MMLKILRKVWWLAVQLCEAAEIDMIEELDENALKITHSFLTTIGFGFYTFLKKMKRELASLASI